MKPEENDTINIREESYNGHPYLFVSNELNEERRFIFEQYHVDFLGIERVLPMPEAYWKSISNSTITTP